MVVNLTKRMSIVAGMVALVIGVPGFATAKTVLASPTRTIAAQPASTSLVEQLQLSDQQKQKIRAIRTTRNQNIAKVLNGTQRTKLQQALKSGTKLGAALQSLGLNADQKKRISGYVRQSNQDIKGVLTKKQQQQLESYMKQRQAGAQTPIE